MLAVLGIIFLLFAFFAHPVGFLALVILVLMIWAFGFLWTVAILGGGFVLGVFAVAWQQR